MTTSKYWTPLTIFLIAIIAIGSIIVLSGYNASQPVEISISNPPPQATPDEIYIDGAVNNPGLYPLITDDSIETLLKATGGTTGTRTTALKLRVSEIVEEEPPQKINLNRAEAWLLEALPGIGETRAKAIIDHRNQNGPFRNTGELVEVNGIGTKTYELLKHLIKVVN